MQVQVALVVPLSLLSLGLVAWRALSRPSQRSLRSVAILVLGDIGRSPRMMNHAQSFAENGFETDLVGYGGSKPIAALGRLPNLRLRYIPEPPKLIRRSPLKVFHQTFAILFVLGFQIRIPPEFILVQNPPSIPTLFLVQLVGKIRGCKVIIDWHNLGYSILALRLGQNHILVRTAKWLEKTFGRRAYAHLFVTKAMKDHLTQKWDLQGKKVILYDRPPRRFHRSTAHETHELFQRLHSSLLSQSSLSGFLPTFSPPNSTPFTQIPDSPPGSATLLPNRPLDPKEHHEKPGSQLPTLRRDRLALLVSSTSWTPDEDFDILLDALQLYELSAPIRNSVSPLPKVLVVVTGKGPLRESYMKKISAMQEKWNWVRCVSLWLEAEDYPVLLGSADLGISLHSSSSALDLPMKVVDMFGCGLPVCALKFDCLHELVKDKVNGYVFSDATILAAQLEELLTSFPNSPKLRHLADSLQSPARHLLKDVANDTDDQWIWTSWEENWGQVMENLVFNVM